MDKRQAMAEIVRLVRGAEPNPVNWLMCVVRIADETERVRAEQLPICGAVSLDAAAFALVQEATKHALEPAFVVSAARRALSGEG